MNTEIKANWNNLNLNVTKVTYLISKKDPAGSYSYLIEVERNINLKDLRNIGEIGHAKVKWENYVNKTKVTQCSNC